MQDKHSNNQNSTAEISFKEKLFRTVQFQCFMHFAAVFQANFIIADQRSPLYIFLIVVLSKFISIKSKFQCLCSQLCSIFQQMDSNSWSDVRHKDILAIGCPFKVKYLSLKHITLAIGVPFRKEIHH